MQNNPWNDPNYPFLDFTEYSLYARIHNQKPVSALESSILFAGSCDISGQRKEKYWHEIYCETLGLNKDDYVKIGTMGQPMNALVRKIYGYLKLVKTPPKRILMVAPVSLPEFIIDGKAYPIPRTFEVVEFFERLDIIPKETMPKLIHTMVAHRQCITDEHILYEFCQNFSFLEMITKAYDIELYWTPNLTRKAKQYYKNIDIFLKNHDFANRTFLGYDNSTVEDSSKDLDFPSAKSHVRLANLFLSINKI